MAPYLRPTSQQWFPSPRLWRRALRLLLLQLALFTAHSAHALSYWFDSPASRWSQEGLPIGNGAMGAVVTGHIDTDSLQFNEKTLWEGGPGSPAGYHFGHPKNPASYLQALAKVQRAIENKGQLPPEEVAAQLGLAPESYGRYQNFGEMVVNFQHPGARSAKVTHYRRQLDIHRAVAQLSYQRGGIRYTREYFASFPDKVIAIRLRADRPEALHFSVSLRPSAGRSVRTQVAGNRLTVSGRQNENGLQYEAQLRVITSAEKITSHDGKSVSVRGAQEALILLAAGSNYAPTYPNYRGAHPHQRLSASLNDASQHGAAALLARHIADYQRLFARVTLNLHGAMPDKTIGQLLREYRGGGPQDLALEELLFQFGRYLLIAASRPGSPPANLQGVWNHTNSPPWNADYHVNINLQMNYWPALVTNLAETNTPLLDFIDTLIEPGRIAARTILGVERGWTLFLNTNIFGFTGLIDYPQAFWQPEAAAWLVQHYYEHYLFTGDKNLLATRAYPAMKGAAQVWLQALVEDKRDGSLVVNPSYSPEHGYFSAGAAMSQQIIVDLLSNTHAAAKLVGDTAFALQLAHTRKKLDSGLRVGQWGQLQEWKTDRDDPDNQHRHVSHLFALYPGRQVSVYPPSHIAKAMATSLNARGDAGTGWAKAWKINLWARLLNGDRAHKLLSEQVKHSTLPNMWSNHPPFQIDGNFGMTAGMAEMLLQSHRGEIHLLPALPKAWPRGEISGLVARGNCQVAIAWQNGRLHSATLSPEHSGPLILRLNPGIDTLSLKNLDTGKTSTVKTSDDGLIRFYVRQQQQYGLYIHGTE